MQATLLYLPKSIARMGVAVDDTRPDCLSLDESGNRDGTENAADPNSVIWKRVEASCERMIPAEIRAGDRIRTGDVQLGKRGLTSAEKCRTRLLCNRLRLLLRFASRADVGENSQRMQSFCIDVAGMQKNAETVSPCHSRFWKAPLAA